MHRLEDELSKLAGSDLYPFHMPGHKRQPDGACRTDITEIDGFDNLHDPQDLLLEEMRFAADFYHVRDTFFLVNGSTCGILAAVSAAVPRGGRLLISRGSHISVYHAACLRDLTLAYMEDPAGPDAPDAVLLTSPTYEGCVRDVGKWAEYARERGIPLIVDEAHGAHFSLHPYFPRSAVENGADLVIQSTHKTLTSMTQTALLHNVTGRVDSRALRRYLSVYETSSPSYVLLASITATLHFFADRQGRGGACLDAYAARLKKLRDTLSSLRSLRLLGGRDAVMTDERDYGIEGEPGAELDPGKLVILGGGKITGPALYDRLRREFRLQPEMKAPDYVLLMTSPADTEEGFGRLARALAAIDAELSAEEAGSGGERGDAREFRGRGAGRPAGGIPGRSGESSPGVIPERSGEPSPGVILPPVELRCGEAWDMPSEEVPLEKAAGRICADFVVVYPPDSPLVIPGERITEEITERILFLRARGITVSGTEGGTIRCAAAADPAR